MKRPGRKGWLGLGSGVDVHTRGSGEGEGGGYGRVEDGIADRVEGRHGIPALRTRDDFCLSGFLAVPRLAGRVQWRISERLGTGSCRCARFCVPQPRGTDSTVVLVVRSAHQETRYGPKAAFPGGLSRC